MLLTLTFLAFCLCVSCFPVDVFTTSEETGEDESVTEKIAKINTANNIRLFEGDIAISINDHVDTSSEGDIDVDASVGRLRRNAQRYKEGLWPGRVIPYEIDPSIPSSYNPTIASAINEFHTKTCLTIRPKNLNDTTWVTFIYKKGCWSYVGRKFWQKSSGQEISLGKECNSMATVMHELMHAAGFWHEHSRTDRNQYVEIMWENIREDQANNFNKYSHDMVDNLQIPYDFTSIMHYGRKQFSKNGQPTIRAIHDPDTPLGQNNGFSSSDVQGINTLYNCKQGNSNINGWTPWSSYGPCNINCIKKRQRYCFSDNPGVDCPGNHANSVETEVGVCPNNECFAPIDGHWGRWSSWGQCTRPCGSGSRNRTRLCDDPPPTHGGMDCAGSRLEYQVCYLRRCGLGPDDCQFDYGNFCFWTNDVTNPNGFDWIRQSGPTPSRNTGPTADHSNGQDHYLFIESSSPAQTGYKARLQSKNFPATNGRCLSFWYHMWGNTIGELNVYIKTNKGGVSKLWSKTGNQGNAWQQGHVSLLESTDYEIVFEAVRGVGFTGDIAIDDVQFKETPCFEAIGCYNDGIPRTLDILVKDLRPKIDWFDMLKTVHECARLVNLQGFKIFGIQFYGECRTRRNDSLVQYDKYGKSSNGCWSGVGGPNVNYVYRIL